MADQLIRLGHEVEVVTARPNYPKGRIFDGHGARLYVNEVRDNVVVHRVWVYPAMGGGIRRILNYISFTLTCLLGLIRCKKPDYLFVESPPLLTVVPAYLLKVFWHVPFIFNVADLWPDAIVDNGFLRQGVLAHSLLALESFSYREAAYVNAVTEGIHDSLLTQKKVPADKVLFLPNGVDTVRYQPRPPDLPLKCALGLEDKQILLWAGTLGFAHGLDNVLHAAKILERYQDIQFLFLGDGSARSHLEKLAGEMQLRNVTFKDPVSMNELPPYYSIATCGLASLKPMPTHDGARPSKIFPVLACGKPLIFVGSGECARLVESAHCGVVVPPEDADALAAQIRSLISYPTQARQMGMNGRRFVEEHFDWSHLVRSWVSHLQTTDPQPSLKAQPSTP